MLPNKGKPNISSTATLLKITSTPLASIFGSGFLIVVPILAGTVGQFSAAVADTLAATWNLTGTTQTGLKEKWAYLIVGITAIILTWTADTYELVSLASRAFAFYYMLQCFVAISVNKSRIGKIAISCLASVLGFITIFAVPAG